MPTPIASSMTSNASFSSLPHFHLVSCRVNVRSGFAVFAKFGRNLELKLMSPRKLLSSATLVGSVSRTAWPFPLLVPQELIRLIRRKYLYKYIQMRTPCLFKSSPMKAIWLIPILHLSLLRVKFLSWKWCSNVIRFLSCSSVVFPREQQCHQVYWWPQGSQQSSALQCSDTVQEHCSHQNSASCNETVNYQLPMMSWYPWMLLRAQFDENPCSCLAWRKLCFHSFLSTPRPL